MERRDLAPLRLPYPLPPALAELRRLYGPHVPLHVLHDLEISGKRPPLAHLVKAA